MDQDKLERLITPPDLTPGIEGIGGTLKSEPADFLVEEIPLYEADGEGSHAFLWVQKQNVASLDLVDVLAQHFEIDRRDIGTAGLKDKAAITRQWVSIPIADGVDEAAMVGPVGEGGVEVLQAVRHTKKLKRGHLRGNKFDIRIRGVADRPEDVEAITQQLQATGLPNIFGPQRFGSRNSTYWMGYRVLTGDTPKKLRRNRRLLSLSLNAVQSAVFNAVVARRMREGTLRTAILGDILETPDGLYRVKPERLDEAASLLESPAVHILGPLPGTRLLPTEEDALALEREVFAEFELTDELFENSRHKKVLSGVRRAMTIPMASLQTEWLKEGGSTDLQISFSLPSGSYATVLLSQFMKPNHSITND